MPRPNSRPRLPLLDAAIAQLRDHIYVQDEGAFLILLGVLGANYFKGDPIWVLIVGSSGCGKTQMLRALCGAVPHMIKPVTEITKAAFMPGTAKKDRTKDSTGGLLKELQDADQHFIAWLEYGAITSMMPSDLQPFANLQRQIYDGIVNKSFGSDGGMESKWSGKIGQFGAITDNIDDIMAEEAKRGVRWMCWRFPKTDGEHEASNSLDNHHTENRMDSMASIFSMVFEAAEFEWGMDLPRELTTEERKRLIRVAKLCSKLQGVISRDRRTNEIVGLPTTVMPTRAAQSLRNVYLALERLGLDNTECWYQVTKLAIDSASGLRVAVLNYLAHQQSRGIEAINYAKMAEDLPSGEGAVRREVEDLWKLGFLVKVAEQTGTAYKLRDDEFEILVKMAGLDW